MHRNEQVRSMFADDGAILHTDEPAAGTHGTSQFRRKHHGRLHEQSSLHVLFIFAHTLYNGAHGLEDVFCFFEQGMVLPFFLLLFAFLLQLCLFFIRKIIIIKVEEIVVIVIIYWHGMILGLRALKTTLS